MFKLIFIVRIISKCFIYIHPLDIRYQTFSNAFDKTITTCCFHTNASNYFVSDVYVLLLDYIEKKKLHDSSLSNESKDILKII